jgi:hypothetical protein
LDPGGSGRACRHLTYLGRGSLAIDPAGSFERLDEVGFLLRVEVAIAVEHDGHTGVTSSHSDLLRVRSGRDPQ